MRHPSLVRSLALASVALLVALLCGFQCSKAKEIEATTEWTLLGENDTVDAGMHIRMNLETGQKWVKLLSDDDVDKSSGRSNQLTVQVDANGDIVASDDAGPADGDVPHLLSTALTEDDLKDYDFDMMHRTLSQLPDKEKERMQLPDVPISQEQRAFFEKRMADIWLARQEELRQLQQEVVADLPQLLKDRIARLHDYFRDPQTELVAAVLAEKDKYSEEGDSGDEDDDTVSHIVSVLKDLEFHLTDIDMSRDFFTMGGWPLLVSLVSSEAHVGGGGVVKIQTNGTTLITSEEVLAVIHKVQALAAWSIGTAVKNTDEFHSLAVEPVMLLGLSSDVKHTALGVLTKEVAILMEQETRPEESNDRLHKFLYAIGSLLRGNREAQLYFCAIEGPELLGALFLSSVTSSAVHENDKVAKRLVTLAHDIVADVTLHAGKSAQVDEAIVGAFATDVWCSAIASSLDITSLDEIAIQTTLQLHPYCNDKWAENDTMLLDRLTSVQHRWELNAIDLDPDLQNERMELLNSVMERLKTTKQ